MFIQYLILKHFLLKSHFFHPKPNPLNGNGNTALTHHKDCNYHITSMVKFNSLISPLASCFLSHLYGLLSHHFSFPSYVVVVVVTTITATTSTEASLPSKSCLLPPSPLKYPLSYHFSKPFTLSFSTKATKTLLISSINKNFVRVKTPYKFYRLFHEEKK